MANASKEIMIDILKGHILKAGRRAQALATFNLEWQLTQRTFDRYWREAGLKAKALNQTVQQQVTDTTIQQTLSATGGAILTAHERMAELTKIAKGEIKLPSMQVRWDPSQNKFVTIPFNALPSAAARVSAIAELNRMDGETGKKPPIPLPPLPAPDQPVKDIFHNKTDEELLQMLNAKTKIISE
jgi:hypothetical protein